VGTYRIGGIDHGYVYNLLTATYTTVDDPNAVINPGFANGTNPNGILGQQIVGQYIDSQARPHGFLFDGTTYTTIDVPAAFGTSAAAVEGSKIIGWYLVGGRYRGFVTIPEPSTIALLLLLSSHLFLRSRCADFPKRRF
jgi:hypothetical protein